MKFFENENEIMERYANSLRSGNQDRDYETWREEKDYKSVDDYNWEDGPPNGSDYEHRSAYYQDISNFENDDDDDDREYDDYEDEYER